ncbi:hypothetical protein [Haloferula sp.]|uniref:hypothetical protein n=1 Tax=Haloferula sp. TaxID=2497595 RepID=UPI00329C1FD7
MMPRLLFLPLLLASCVPGSYTRDFVKETAVQPKPPTSVEGAWIGEWKSEVNGHEGPLWCIVHPNDEEPGHYDFRYRAGWGLVHFGDYTHTVEVAPDASGNLPLEGEMELPAGLGTYTVKGELTREEFKATYKSKADRGSMVLKRP